MGRKRKNGLNPIFYIIYDLNDNFIGLFDDYQNISDFLGHKNTDTVRHCISRGSMINLGNGIKGSNRGIIYRFDDRELEKI